MRRRKKKLKAWQKWLIGSVTLLAGLVVTAVIFLYYQIHAIQVEDILKRHQALEATSGTAPSGEVANASGQSNEATLPSVLNAPVDKANEFANKPIQTQDALDVAAILLKSGLSLKEVYYLTGQASSDLSNEEKQKIRDLLLSKLSKEEINALRAITKPYGKGLLILDPNYPIELIGIEDPAERKRLQAELQAKKAQTQEQTQPKTIPSPSPAAAAEVAQPTATPGTGSMTADASLIATYEGRLNALKSSCQNTVSQLVSSVVQAKQSNKDLSLKSLQGMFMQKFVDAETKCDAGFSSILNDAGKAGVNSEATNAWKKSYADMKQQAQSSAMNQLITLFASSAPR